MFNIFDMDELIYMNELLTDFEFGFSFHVKYGIFGVIEEPLGFITTFTISNDN